MSDKIAIMGAGALGCYVGAFLTREGEDVTFIDMWPEHVEKMRKDGLHVSGSQGPFTVPVKAMHLTDAQGITEPFDFAFIAMKSYDTEWATHFIKRYVKDTGFFVSLQNCWNDVPIAEIVGQNRAIGCIASHIEVALWEPGHVTRGGAVGRDSGHHVFRVGEQDERLSPRSEKMADDAGLHRRLVCHKQPVGAALGQALPKRDGKRPFGSLGHGLTGHGRRPTLPLDTDKPVQGRRTGGLGHGPSSGGRSRSGGRDLGRRRQGRRVRRA